MKRLCKGVGPLLKVQVKKGPDEMALLKVHIQSSG